MALVDIFQVRVYTDPCVTIEKESNLGIQTSSKIYNVISVSEYIVIARQTGTNADIRANTDIRESKK